MIDIDKEVDKAVAVISTNAMIDPKRATLEESCMFLEGIIDQLSSQVEAMREDAEFDDEDANDH